MSSVSTLHDFLSTRRVRWGFLHRSGRRRTIQDRDTHPVAVTAVPTQPEGPFRGTTRSSRWQRLSHGLYAPRDSRCSQEFLTNHPLRLPGEPFASTFCWTAERPLAAQTTYRVIVEPLAAVACAPGLV